MTAAPRESSCRWAPPGPFGRRQRPRRPEPLLTLLRARGPLAAPAEPSRAGPSPSRAAPNRTEAEPKPGRAEPSGAEVEPSGAEPLAQANKMAAWVLPARERAVQTAGCLRSNSPRPRPRHCACALPQGAGPSPGSEERPLSDSGARAPWGAGPRRGGAAARARLARGAAGL